MKVPPYTIIHTTLPRQHKKCIHTPLVVRIHGTIRKDKRTPSTLSLPSDGRTSQMKVAQADVNNGLSARPAAGGVSMAVEACVEEGMILMSEEVMKVQYWDGQRPRHYSTVPTR